MEILSWFLVEALSATALLLLIVWWTWPRKPKDAESNTKPITEPKKEQEPPK